MPLSRQKAAPGASVHSQLRVGVDLICVVWIALDRHKARCTLTWAGSNFFRPLAVRAKQLGPAAFPMPQTCQILYFAEQSHGIWKGKTGLPPDTLPSSVPLRTRLHELLNHALPVQVLQSKLRHDAGERALLPECNGAIMYECYMSTTVE